MKKGTIINLNKNDLVAYFSKNKIIFMLTVTVLLGLLVGCLTFSKSDILINFGKKCFTFITKNRQEQSFLNIFTYSLTIDFLILLTYFLCGASLMGVIFVPILSFSSGFLYAVISSYICDTYLLKGIAFNALILLPPIALLIIVLLVAGKRSINFSFEFIKLTMPNQRALNLFFQFKEYCVHYLVYVSLCLISAVVDGLLSKTLISYFDFI